MNDAPGDRMTWEELAAAWRALPATWAAREPAFERASDYARQKPERAATTST